MDFLYGELKMRVTGPGMSCNYGQMCWNSCVPFYLPLYLLSSRQCWWSITLGQYWISAAKNQHLISDTEELPKRSFIVENCTILCSLGSCLCMISTALHIQFHARFTSLHTSLPPFISAFVSTSLQLTGPVTPFSTPLLFFLFFFQQLFTCL